MRPISCLFFLVLGLQYCCFSQDSIMRNSDRYVDAVASKSRTLQKKIDAETQRSLKTFKKNEKAIRDKILKADTSLAKELFGNLEDRYGKLQKMLEDPDLSHYVPKVDTLLTSLKFLESLKGVSANGMERAYDNIKDLGKELQKSEIIKKYILQRRELLERSLTKYDVSQEMLKFNKTLFYYSQQVSEFKSILNDSRKLERTVINLLSRTEIFKTFMRENSQLASMFGSSASSGSSANAQNLSGLQTRAQVNSMIRGQLAPGGIAAQDLFTKNMQEARNQLSKLKEKVDKYGAGSSDDIMPEGFKPNALRSKTFLERIEVTANIQSRRSSSFYPVSSDIGLGLAYRLKENCLVGIGMSYKVNWGTGWDNIRISHEGLGIRSSIDWKLKKSFWITGGYEKNYISTVSAVGQNKNLAVWQTSGLLGITKIVDLSSKVFKKTRLQLLWDFLANNQYPTAQPIIFRVGYTLN